MDGIESTISKRLILEFEGWRYSFNRFDVTISDAEAYDLAIRLNAFQAEKPPKSIGMVVRTDIFAL